MPKAYAVGLSLSQSTGTVFCEKTFSEMKEAGLDLLEISEGHLSDYTEYDPAGIKKATERAGVTLWSVHLPFAPFEQLDLSSLQKEIRENAVAVFSEMIKTWSAVGVDKFVLHPSGEPIEEETRKERLCHSAESLAKLARIADRNGAVVAVENLPRSCCGHNSAEMRELTAAHEALLICLDTNHLLQEEAADFVRRVGDKIITTHVSDFDFVNERHWLPGEGDINWPALLKALEDSGYSGPWLYEVNQKAPATIRRRNLTFRDYYENARALFAGELPRVIGKRKENLGFWG